MLHDISCPKVSKALFPSRGDTGHSFVNVDVDGTAETWSFHILNESVSSAVAQTEGSSVAEFMKLNARDGEDLSQYVFGYFILGVLQVVEPSAWDSVEISDLVAMVTRAHTRYDAPMPSGTVFGVYSEDYIYETF